MGFHGDWGREKDEEKALFVRCNRLNWSFASLQFGEKGVCVETNKQLECYQTLLIVRGNPQIGIDVLLPYTQYLEVGSQTSHVLLPPPKLAGREAVVAQYA